VHLNGRLIGLAAADVPEGDIRLAGSGEDRPPATWRLEPAP
jgi:hypothetical protein